MTTADPFKHFARLQTACAGLPPLTTAVACPDNEPALAGVLEAVEAGLIEPILVGNPEKIAAAAQALGMAADRFQIVAAGNEAQAATHAVEQVRLGHARAVMKGNLHSDTLLAAIVQRDTGLRAGKRLSHVFVTDMPGFNRPLAVSDGALNIAPDVNTRADIIENAGLLMRACGVARPNVAVLSALETVNPAIVSSVEAAELTALADQGRFAGLQVYGPLAMDNAISAEAARIKKISSPVAGHADVLLVPTIEAGNMVVKALTFVAGADCAGIVMGAQVPVMLTSRADSALARRMSCVLALLVEHFQRTGNSALAG